MPLNMKAEDGHPSVAVFSDIVKPPTLSSQSLRL
jgi:hypothetical protein